jgi:hypothetical protein
MAIRGDHRGTLNGSRYLRHIGKVVDNIGYKGILDPVYHGKQTFNLGSSNRTQFSLGIEHEWHPPMQEP